LVNTKEVRIEAICILSLQMAEEMEQGGRYFPLTELEGEKTGREGKAKNSDLHRSKGLEKIS